MNTTLDGLAPTPPSGAPPSDVFDFTSWYIMAVSELLEEHAGQHWLQSHGFNVTVMGKPVTMTAADRFALVSSLYAPGNLICWLSLVLSVVISWTFNPRTACEDTITNDFIAALAMPITAVAHFFHQIHKHTNDSQGITELFSNVEWDNVQAVAAIEASLAVCEDFIRVAAVLHFIAGQRHKKLRMSMVVAVGLACLSAETLLITSWLPFEKSLLVRPFVFHCLPAFWILATWVAATAIAYLFEISYAFVLDHRRHDNQEVESASMRIGRAFLPGHISSWMAACTGIVAGFVTIFVKYLWIYPIYSATSFRLAAKTLFSLSELDQVVTMLGGLLALAFSIRDAVKERRLANARLADQARDHGRQE